MANDIIFGKNSVMEALIAGDREINKILISKNIHSDNKLNKIKELARERGIVFMQNITIKGLSLKSPPSNIWIWMIF